MIRHSFLEPLEARIALAATIVNPLFDVIAATGQTGVTIDLDTMLDATKSYRTQVQLVTNFTPPGATAPGVITIELFNDKAPLTVANFLRYVNSADAKQDYDGLFFHRLVKGFVLQGGGLSAADNTHIPTFPAVHNEFDPADPERSNIIQTIAMAKVGADQAGGPHSATSEFFINLADNAANLNNQNGGFTVFGRITDDSMAVVNAIADLPQSGDVPVQNYAGSGAPSPDQKIQIVDARVVVPGAAADAGYQYTVNITDAALGGATNLVTAKLNAGNDLALKFAPGKAGVAKVQVTVSKSGEVDVIEEFNVTVKPNLVPAVIEDGLDTTFVPGDHGIAKVKLTNTAGGSARGNVTVKLYLSKISAVDAAGYTLQETGADADTLLATLSDVHVNIASGKSATIPVKFVIPGLTDAEGELIDGKRYRLIAKIESVAELQELFTDDNVGVFQPGNVALNSPAVMPFYDLAFGDVGTRKNVRTAYTADGVTMTFTLSGVGTGTFSKDATGNLSLIVSGTDAASALSAKTSQKAVGNVEDLLINSSIGHVKLGLVHLHGTFSAGGGAKSIAFGNLGSSGPSDLASDQSFSVNAFPQAAQKLSVKLGAVNDYSFFSGMPVAKLAAREWLNDESSTADDEIFALSLGDLRIAGDLQADVTIGSDSKLGQFRVAGDFARATLKTFGDIGVVSLGSITSSNIFVGLSEQPDALADFAAGRSIGSFTVAGLISDSVVAAAHFNSVSVGAIDAAAGTTTKGFYADAIRTYIRKSAPIAKFSRLDAPLTVDASSNYEVQIF